MRRDGDQISVVQWTTGNVGRRSVQAVAANPHLDLIGCYAWSPDKVGRDVGELCGIDPTGVIATNDIEALLALCPECVVYNPMWPDVDELVRILSAGVNVVSTAAFITGHSMGADRERIAAACAAGRSTMFGTGVNPGFVQLFALLATNLCDRVDCVRISECGDATEYDSPETELPAGFARPIDDPELPAMTRKGTGVFEDAIRMIADAMDVELEDVTCEAEYAQTTEHLDLGSWEIPKGCVAGIRGTWRGIARGRTVAEINFTWKKGYTLEPDWPLQETYVIDIEGRPTLQIKLQPLPPPDFEAGTFADFLVLGMIMTAMPAIHAIPLVVAADPGILTYSDLPLPFPRGAVS